jgi:hypothetical protein
MKPPVKTLVAAALATSALLAQAPASAHDGEVRLSAQAMADLGDARRATAAFVDINVATSAAGGYGPSAFADAQGITCIASAQPGKGAMGIHYVNGAHLMAADPTPDAKRPEALIYEPMPDGTLRLVGVEYIVFQSAWTDKKPPRLFGVDFHLTPAGNRYGIPAFYALHVWMWEPNRSGLFADWNPAVRCP